jgi:hypothetical protein
MVRSISVPRREIPQELRSGKVIGAYPGLHDKNIYQQGLFPGEFACLAQKSPLLPKFRLLWSRSIGTVDSKMIRETNGYARYVDVTISIGGSGSSVRLLMGLSPSINRAESTSAVPPNGLVQTKHSIPTHTGGVMRKLILGFLIWTVYLPLTIQAQQQSTARSSKSYGPRLYGDSVEGNEDSIRETILNGRPGHMPGWSTRYTPIKLTASSNI